MLTTGSDNPNTNNMMDGVGIYTAPQYTNTYVKQKEKPVFGKAECVLSAIVFILSVLYIRFVIFMVTGAVSSLIYLAFITSAIIYMKKKGCSFSGFNKTLTVILYLFSFVFTLTDNSFIKFLNGVFLFTASAYLIYSVCAGKTSVERYLPYAVKKAVFEYPFSKFGTQADILSCSFKHPWSGTNIKRILAGLLLAGPVTAVVGSLLMSADDGMNRLLNNIFEGIYSENIWDWIIQISMALPFSCYVFGMIYRNVFRSDISELSDSYCEEKLEGKRAVGNLVFYSAVTPVLILYVIFFFMQAGYFLSAFMGRLPDGFSYAEYARKGFFELCWIVVINLGIMIIMNLHSKNSGKDRSSALKAYNLIFCVFTLILIATALSKMVMYIDAYGLTVLRVYTTWFMVLCAFIFLMIMIKQFRPDMHIAKSISAGFTVMFALLCFSRPESLIVKYNHAMGKVSADTINESGILDMSDDGLLAAVNEGILSAEQAKNYNHNGYGSHEADRLNLSTLVLESK